MLEETNEGEMMGEAVVAITGASGARYGVRLLEALSEAVGKPT